MPLLVGAGAGLLVTAVRTAVLRSGAWPAFGAATDRSNGRALGALPDADLWWVAALPALSEVPPPLFPWAREVGGRRCGSSYASALELMRKRSLELRFRRWI